MASRNAVPFISYIARAESALGLGQRQFGELLGVSRSTVSRWYSRGFTGFTDRQLRVLVSAVHARDPALAAEIAASQKETLVSLGVVPPPAPAPPPPRAPLSPFLGDAVLCAAAEIAALPPATVRPVLVAAFERAKAAGLTVEDALAQLKGKAPARGSG